MLVFSHLLRLYLTRQSRDLSDIKIDRPNCTILMIDLLGVHVYWWEYVLVMSSCGINCLNSPRLIYESARICGVHILRLYRISFVLLLLKLLKFEDNYWSFQMCCKRPCVVDSHCLGKGTQKSRVYVNAYVCINEHG